MNPIDTPVASTDVVLRDEFDDWTLLFHPLTGETVGIDPVGLAIWGLLDGRRTLADIAAEIQAQFEDTPDTVLDDTVAFANDLERRLFITLSPDDVLVK
ncbi:MAG: PqqD family peptide modification chaperone [Chloroflexi bacterium]|nr:PqqD family peptide modification chaperone [Chloroflexota bacterium]MBU1747152.1 PqqD family peptide modification chaperone [Chloroflexota bacterium]